MSADPTPTTQVSTVTWITAVDVYYEPDEVLAALRREIEEAERRQSDADIPGKVIIGITTSISADEIPSALKG